MARVLTTKLLLSAVLAEHDTDLPPKERAKFADVNRSIERLRVLIRQFDNDVWFGGLQEYVRAAKVHGHSTLISTTLQALLYVMAGRVMITLAASSGESITLITDETSSVPCMGVQGIRATEEQAEGMLSAAITAWKSGVCQFKPDSDVSMF